MTWDCKLALCMEIVFFLQNRVYNEVMNINEIFKKVYPLSVDYASFFGLNERLILD